jgi:CopG family nickel-responsive transcriptional regulator
MKRLTMSLDDNLAEAFEALMRERGYRNRSEAFRDLLRHGLGETRRFEQPKGPCVAALSYLYNHHERQLALRLTDAQHAHHEITVSSVHVHLDHDHCLEAVLLKGPTDEVQAFARSVISQSGVSHGQLHLIPVAFRHAHGHDHLEPLAAHPEAAHRTPRPAKSNQQSLPKARRRATRPYARR